MSRHTVFRRTQSSSVASTASPDEPLVGRLYPWLLWATNLAKLRARKMWVQCRHRGNVGLSSSHVVGHSPAERRHQKQSASNVEVQSSKRPRYTADCSRYLQGVEGRNVNEPTSSKHQLVRCRASKMLQNACLQLPFTTVPAYKKSLAKHFKSSHQYLRSQHHCKNGDTDVMSTEVWLTVRGRRSNQRRATRALCWKRHQIKFEDIFYTCHTSIALPMSWMWLCG